MRVEKLENLGNQIRRGRLPEGHTSDEVMQAIVATAPHQCGEIWGVLSAKHIPGDGSPVRDLGVICTRKITEAFRDYIVDSLQDSTTYPMDAFKYHASGTDNTAENNSDTALGAEVEAARVVGTQAEGATADIYKSVATITYTDTRNIVEHCIFSAASGGTAMDRSVFAAIAVVNTDQIEFTYEATFNAEA